MSIITLKLQLGELEEDVTKSLYLQKASHQDPANLSIFSEFPITPELPNSMGKDRRCPWVPPVIYIYIYIGHLKALVFRKTALCPKGRPLGPLPTGNAALLDWTSVLVSEWIDVRSRGVYARQDNCSSAHGLGWFCMSVAWMQVYDSQWLKHLGL